jgi:hypothetical protein
VLNNIVSPKNKKIKNHEADLKTSSGCAKWSNALMESFDFHSRYKHASPKAVRLYNIIKKTI